MPTKSKLLLHIGILNTLYPAHTKEHGGYEPYVAAKIKLLEMSDYALIGAQATEVIQRSWEIVQRSWEVVQRSWEVVQRSWEVVQRSWELELSATHKTYLYGHTGKRTFHDGRFREDEQKLFDDAQMLLLGEHNRQNTCSVIGICRLLDIDLSHLQNVLKSFSGLEHRIEYVGTFHDIKRYDDAIATTPQATMAAIETFKNELDTIFLGGIEGEYEFSGVVKLLKKYQVKNVVLFPDTGPRIKELLDPTTQNLFETRSMQEAVEFAARHTQAWKVALLSCGSPSFSLRTSYTQKGQQFKDAVNEIESRLNHRWSGIPMYREK